MPQKKLPHSALKKLTNGELRMLLAQQRMDEYPKLYAGHYDDALKFVKNNYKNRKDLVLGATTSGLVAYEWER